MRPLLLFLMALLLGLAAGSPVQAQNKYLTKKGFISFFSTSPIEDIEARNQQVAAVLDLGSGQLAFALPITGFVFKRALMQEHFNESYLESEKYPKATFAGQFTGATAATLAIPGPHPAQASGDLTIHGVTRRITAPDTLELKNGQLLATASFDVAPADYKIEIPLLVRNSIAKIVAVKVVLACEAVK